MPFQGKLLELAEVVRDKGMPLARVHMHECIRRAHPTWLAEYIEQREAANRKPRHADALAAMCRYTLRGPYSYRVSTASKFSTSELRTIKLDFAGQLWLKYHTTPTGMSSRAFDSILLHVTTRNS